VLRAAQVGDRAPATAGGPPTISGLPQFRLELEDGSAVTACGRGLIGRQPVPAVDEHVDHYVTLADDTLVVSTPRGCSARPESRRIRCMPTGFRCGRWNRWSLRRRPR
jgi:hypothetical protein